MTRVPWRRLRPGRWTVLQGVLPVRRSQVTSDVLAGVTLAALGIPEVLGYAKIAGMPVVTGLYTLVIPDGRVRRPRVLPPPCGRRGLRDGGHPRRVSYRAGRRRVGQVRAAGRTGRAAGRRDCCCLARLARLGFLANFLSRTVLVGFLTGVGIQVAAGQLPDMLGVKSSGSDTLRRLWDAGIALLRTTHFDTAAVSAGVIAVVVAARAESTRKIPGALIAVIAAIVVSQVADLARAGRRGARRRPQRAACLQVPALGLVGCRRRCSASRRRCSSSSWPRARRPHAPTR